MSGQRRILLLTEDAALAALLPPRLAPGTSFQVETAAPQAGLELLLQSGGRIDATLLDAAAQPGPTHWAPMLRAASGGRPLLLLGGEAGPEALPPGTQLINQPAATAVAR